MKMAYKYGTNYTGPKKTVSNDLLGKSHPNQQNRQPPIQSEKYQCRIDTVSSADDGHTVARNM